MKHPEYQYLQLMADILRDGKTKKTRGIHDVKSIFGAQVHFDMRAGFPLLTTKKNALQNPAARAAVVYLGQL
jgi:thymidylate synthase